MAPPRRGRGNEKKERKAAAAARRRAVDGAVRAALEEVDWLGRLNSFFSRYDAAMLGAVKEGQPGPYVLRYMHAGALSEELRQWAFDLLKENMQELYEGGWGWSDKEKHEQLCKEDARFLVAFTEEGEEPAGYVDIHFEVEDMRPVLVEIQVAAKHQRQGLGKFLMKVTEMIAFKAEMECVDLTVFKANGAAIDFYSSLGYHLSPHSPELHGDLNEPHQLLRKTIREPGDVGGGGGGATSTGGPSSGN